MRGTKKKKKKENENVFGQKTNLDKRKKKKVLQKKASLTFQIETCFNSTLLMSVIF